MIYWSSGITNMAHGTTRKSTGWKERVIHTVALLDRKSTTYAQ
jgi:hypothetical protein